MEKIEQLGELSTQNFLGGEKDRNLLPGNVATSPASSRSAPEQVQCHDFLSTIHHYCYSAWLICLLIKRPCWGLGKHQTTSWAWCLDELQPSSASSETEELMFGQALAHGTAGAV